MPLKPQSSQKGSGAGSGAAPSSSRPKSKQKGGAPTAASSHLDAPDEEPMAAVILADSYDRHFTPLTLEKPRCLLPLCNVPLINWSLEAVCSAGVAHVYILARSHVDQIKAHIASLADTSMAPVVSGADITVIATPEARSVGDAMRELDAKQILRSDFFLVQPDAVCNIDLERAAREHRARRKVDKEAIMTICAMPVASGSRSRPPSNLPIHCLAPKTGQLLHYDNMGPDSAADEPRGKRASLLPLECIKLSDKGEGEAELDVRADLVEAGIDVCSVDVPALFSENFDYESLRRDFVTGILTSDLLESKIYVRVFSAGVGDCRAYCARARDTRSYDAISQDVLGGWSYPLQPGQNAWLEDLRYQPKSRARYYGADGVVAPTASIGQSTMLGASSIVEAGARITNSVIGPSTRIEAGADVAGSYVWRAARIGKGCRVENSIVGEGATLLDGVKLGRGCLIGGRCVVGPNVTLPAFSRVGIRSPQNEDDEDEDDEQWASLSGQNAGEAATSDAKEPAASHTGAEAGAEAGAATDARLGAGARGFLWPSALVSAHEDEDSDDEEALAGLPPLVATMGVRGADVAKVIKSAASEEEGADTLSSIEGDSELGSDDEDVEDDDDGAASAISSAHSGFANANLTLGGDETAADKAAAAQRLADFRSEAVASLSRAFDEGHSVDNASIELKTLRMASDVPLSEVRRTVISFVLDYCDPAKPREVAQILDKWCPLIQAMAVDDEQEAVLFTQQYCATHRSHTALFIPLLKKFYNDDVVSDEAIVGWWRSPASRDASPVNGGETALELRKKAEAVVRYILEDDDDDDEDEED